jgi:hypothetical protein
MPARQDALHGLVPALRRAQGSAARGRAARALRPAAASGPCCFFRPLWLSFHAHALGPGQAPLLRAQEQRLCTSCSSQQACVNTPFFLRQVVAGKGAVVRLIAPTSRHAIRNERQSVCVGSSATPTARASRCSSAATTRRCPSPPLPSPSPSPPLPSPLAPARSHHGSVR